ncbi:chorismate synthase [Candidatus Stoquefichus sp. SB1]|uniref:chorismate synthase n=1 Tax=Candidatus Stoquefichus sp. SB1 TaxID=1658109 RepID=UPI00067E674E|nr:chorismate synthase [Candidatus Stoquefichus sp. SB1]
MSSTWGTNIELSIFGESHGQAIGIVMGNLPAGIPLDMADIKHQMKRRAPGQNIMSTPRKEKDEVHIMSGLMNNVTTGAPLCAMIYNSDQHSKDYSLLQECMRPGHSDYPAYIKYKGFNDVRGGGHFSGRITAPIVFAGSVAKQILKQKGIVIGAHIQSIKDVYDDSFGVDISSQDIENMLQQQYPTLNPDVFEKMQATIEEARMHQDSVGGMIECAILNVPAGLGNPFFDSIESHLSPLLFSIPAVKSVSFGLGEKITELYGHEANDCYYYADEKVKTKTNHNGGITGGISNGMPIIFKVGIKPTPSISQVQQTINVKTKENTELEITGRHDPCIVPRAVVVVESMAALGILDMIKDI